MIRVRIEPSGRELEVEQGERLLDVLDEQPVPGLRIGCRGAHCGTCLVRIEHGAEAVAEARDDERRTLAELGAEAGARLGCQLVLSGAAGLVVLRVASAASP